MKSFFLKYTLYFVIAALFITIAGCTSRENEQSKSMDQIQKEKGIPVTVKKVTPQKFETYLTFFGKFKGAKETIIGSMIGGRIEKILARPGDFVKKDQVIIEFPEDSPASKYQQAKAAYEMSKKTYERMKALYEKGEISQAQFDGAETKYAVDKRNYEITKDMLKLIAPYNGTITELMVHEGDNVKQKTPLFTIAQLHKMKIRVWLSDEERMILKKGMRVIAKVSGMTVEGKVYELSLSADPFKQSFYADLIFANKDKKILPGTIADIKIITYENDQAITVPRNIVRRNGDETFVFIADGAKAVKRIIKISRESGILYEISSGLRVDDQLIVKGGARLLDGTKINAVN
jgi:RND family efflux transporter MFP subunit